MSGTEEKQLPVVVYGTLKEGYGNYKGYLEGRHEGHPVEVVVNGYHLRDNGGFPYAVPDAPTESIQAELFTITPSQYARVVRGLDGLEGVPSLYTREIVEANLADGSTVEAYMYVVAHRESALRYPKVENGNWEKPSRRSPRASRGETLS